MKRLAAFLLLLILSITCPLPASAQRMTPEQNARAGQKKQQKALKKANKKQAKATRKYARAQRKENAKANRDLQKRRGR